jgi:hypothetical protein
LLLHLLKLILFVDVTPCILLEVYHPVGEMVASIFMVEEYAMWKKTARFLPILYEHLPSFRHVLHVLLFYFVDPATSFSVPILFSPLFLDYSHAMPTSTPTLVLPHTHFRAAITCCLPTTPDCVIPYYTSLAIFPFTAYCVMVIEAGRSCKMVVK